VLEVRWEDDSFIASFTGKLNSEVPGVKGHEGEVEALRDKVFGGKCIEAVDCVPEGTCIADMFPCECSQACAQRCNRGIDRLDEYALPVKLIAGLCVQQNPAKLDHLCRILRDIDSVLITGGGHMNHNVSIQVALLAGSCRRHISCRDGEG
jgi:hypothetical protein